MLADDVDKTSVSPINDATSEAVTSKQVEQPDLAVSSQQEGEITREQLALGKRLLNWRTLVPLIVVVILLIIVAQRANIDPHKTWDAIRSANLLFFVAAFAIFYLSFTLRALRWRILLQNVGYTQANGVHLPKFWKLVEIIYISFFANSIVPAKLGDLYRAYLLRQEIDVSTTRSFGTVIAERMLDLTVLLLLFIPSVIISLREHLPPQILLSLEILMGVVLVGIVGLFVLRQAREPIARLIPTRFRKHYYHFQEGTLGSFRRLPLLAGLSIGVWTCEALRFFFIASALSLIGGSFIHILTAAIVVGLGEALLTAIPTTGGGVGLVEGGMAAMIALYYRGANIVNLTAAAILLDRSITFFSILIIGFVVFLLAFGRKARQQRR